MGTFIGHFAAGSMFIIVALRWMYCIAYRYQLCRREQSVTGVRGYRFRSSMFFPFSCCPGKPAMQYIVLGMSSTYFMVEVFTGSPELRGHHMTMAVSFITMSLGSIIHHYTRVVPLMDYACGLAAMAINVIMFTSHSHGRSTLDMAVHKYLPVSYAWVCIMCLIEMKFKNHPTVALGRSLAALTVGTWWIHIGFVIYSSLSVRWAPEDHMAIMISQLAYTWHIMGNMVVVGLMFVFATLQVNRMAPSEVSLALEIEYFGQSTKHDVAYKKLTNKGQETNVDSDEEFC